MSKVHLRVGLRSFSGWVGLIRWWAGREKTPALRPGSSLSVFGARLVGRWLFLWGVCRAGVALGWVRARWRRRVGLRACDGVGWGRVAGFDFGVGFEAALASMVRDELDVLSDGHAEFDEAAFVGAGDSGGEWLGMVCLVASHGTEV